MDLAMTVETVLPKDVDGRGTPSEDFGSVGNGGMECGRVTLLAESRTAHREQAFVNRSMSPMTEAAVLGHGLVFPQEGAALLAVAPGAVVIDGQLTECELAAPPMGIVTVRAAGLPLEDRMPGGHAERGAKFAVAAEAGGL